MSSGGGDSLRKRGARGAASAADPTPPPPPSSSTPRLTKGAAAMRAICNAQKVLNSPATAGGLDATIKALTDLQAKLKAAGYQAPDELASDSASSEEDELSAPARIRSSRRRDLEPEESGTDDDESDADARSASRSLSGGRRRRNLARTVVENEMRRVAAKLERGYTFWDALRDPEFRRGVFREVLRALLIMGILWTVHSYFLANPPRESGPTTEETVRRIQSDLSRMQRP